MKKLVTIALALTACALLSACQDASPNHTIAPISFGGKPALRVRVAQINVVETYRSPMQAPNIEHTFVTPPAQAIKQWAGQRLVASGSQGTLEISIDDASAKESVLPKEKGIKGFFTDQQDARYDAHVLVTFRLYDGVNTIAMAEGNVDIKRWRTVNEKATVADREKLFNDMVQDMMTQFDSDAELRLRQYFAAYLG